MDPTDLAEITRHDTADSIQQHVVGAVIEHDQRVLLLKRPGDDFRGGTWELPSGKADQCDSDLLAALHREVHEETGLTIDGITAYLGAFDYTSGSGRRTRQHTWSVTVADAAPVRLSEHDDYRWAHITGDHPVSREVQNLITAHAARREFGGAPS